MKIGTTIRLLTKTPTEWFELRLFDVPSSRWARFVANTGSASIEAKDLTLEIGESVCMQISKYTRNPNQTFIEYSGISVVLRQVLYERETITGLKLTNISQNAVQFETIESRKWSQHEIDLWNKTVKQLL